MVPYEIGIILREFVQNGIITGCDINQKISSFKFAGFDGRNKPVDLHVIGRSVSFKQNAARNWCLIRFLPLIFGHMVPHGDSCWDLLLNLKDCVDQIFCPIFTSTSAVGLSHVLQENLQRFKELFPNDRVKPKQHFMVHYPDRYLSLVL